MRYNIKRLYKEYEEYKKTFDKLQALYKEGEKLGKDYKEYSQNTSELNRLRHAMSLCRQNIGQEVVTRLTNNEDLEDSKPEKYQGWTNYATWRVNLECIDGINWVREDITGDEKKELSLLDVANFMENAVEQMIGEYGEREEGLAYEYSIAFIEDVNWYEIATSVAERYPEIIKVV